MDGCMRGMQHKRTQMNLLYSTQQPWSFLPAAIVPPMQVAATPQPLELQAAKSRCLHSEPAAGAVGLASLALRLGSIGRCLPGPGLLGTMGSSKAACWVAMQQAGNATATCFCLTAHPAGITPCTCATSTPTCSACLTAPQRSTASAAGWPVVRTHPCCAGGLAADIGEVKCMQRKPAL